MSPTSGDVKSARRVLELLEYLAAASAGATFVQLGEDLNLPKSSLHGLLATLIDHGWIYFHGSTRTYRIGLRTWQVARSFSQLNLLAQIAQKHLEALRDEINETIQLSVLEGVDNVYIAKFESAHPLRLVSNVGSRLPAYATGLGKVLLAYLEPTEFRRRMSRVKLQPFTTRTVRSLAMLERNLAQIRLQGYGEDESEYTLGVHCVAVPVFGPEGHVIAAISCSIPSVRFGGVNLKHGDLLGPLMRHAEQVSREFAAASEKGAEGISYGLQ